jgi:hypothetical protein
MQSEIATVPYTSIPSELNSEVQNDAEIRKEKRESNVVIDLRDNKQRGQILYRSQNLGSLPTRFNRDLSCINS